MLATAKSKSHPLNGMHTAGIFADPSVDGPLIGTLVAIIDRAKNLPNRKTIGKQDPYCAARLGKEAKKTTTDIRGGQTPKWDQELRFAVHDSPDYYQLKVSVFHDDKKTDLIGETWIDLRDIIVPGGGQNDIWRNLTFKGKYAGEVRMEITYYDIRPKPEKPAPKPRPVEAEPNETYASHGTIPRKQIKRRPLPSDPFTGEAPSIPDQAPTPPRAGGPRGPKEMSASSSPVPEARDQSLSGSRPMPTKKSQPAFVPTQSPLQAIEYNNPAPTAAPAPVSGPRGSQPELPAPASPAALPQPADVTPQHTPTRQERLESPTSHHDERDYSPRFSSQDIVDRAHYRQGSEPPPRDLYLLEDQRHVSAEDERPPPPPAHRSRHSSGNSQDMVLRGSYDTPPKSANAAMRQDVLRNEAHRLSFSSAAYPGRPQYRGFDSAPAITNALPAPDDHYHEPSPPRHHSYDGHAEYRSMQPTVEDVPESPTPAAKTDNNNNNNNNVRRNSRVPPYDELGFAQEQKQAPQAQSMEIANRQTARTSQYQDAGYDQGYDQVPTPAPLNIGSRGSAVSRQRGQSPNPAYGRGDEMGQSGGYSTSPRPDYQPRGDELVFAGRGSASPGHYSTSPQPEYQPDYQQQPEYQPRGDELVLAGRGGVSPAHYSTSPQPYARGDEMVRHQQVSPLSMRDPRGDEMVRHQQVSPIATRDLRGDEMVRHQQPSPIATRDFAPSPGDMAPYNSRSQNSYVSQRSELSGTEIQATGAPAVPASLVPGVDPSLAQEVSDRIYEERRQTKRYTTESVTTPTHGRQQSQPMGYNDQTYVPPNHGHHDYRSSMAYGGQMNRGRGPSPQPPPQHLRGRGVSPQPYAQDMRGRGVSPQPYANDMRSRGVSPQPYAQDMRGRGASPNPNHARGISVSPHPQHRARGLSPAPPQQSRRGVSPNPHHTIKRKSVSPAPPPDHRRLSGIPFGPDSYDALNPTASTISDISRPDPDEKIITHDGREIDPSDHLPMDTWAPEPEPKGPKTPTTASVRSRASPAGSQPMPTSGRRQLRISARPQSQVSPVNYNFDPYNTPAPGSGGRNRLQKKTQRMSALPSTSPAGSSPLAPISSHNYQDHGGDFTPPRLPRASTWDYPSENHAPQYGSSPGRMRGGPPIPAKIPLPVMSGAMGGGQESEWALMQEMSRIDIGAGRSRRHRHY